MSIVRLIIFLKQIDESGKTGLEILFP